MGNNIWILLEISFSFRWWKNWRSVKIWRSYHHEFNCTLFWNTVHKSCLRILMSSCVNNHVFNKGSDDRKISIACATQRKNDLFGYLIRPTSVCYMKCWFNYLLLMPKCTDPGEICRGEKPKNRPLSKYYTSWARWCRAVLLLISGATFQCMWCALNCTLCFMLFTEESLRQQYLEQKKKLRWETDLELHSKFLDRKVLLAVTICILTYFIYFRGHFWSFMVLVDFYIN